jgi:pimeloyl-ACP methyl ester carboxylesterase
VTSPHHITLYWLTGAGTSAARSYWDLARDTPTEPAKVPIGYSVFPGEIFRAPRSWVDRIYPGLDYYNEVDRGGHFAAWEQPELFATEIRAAFRSAR